MATHSSVLAWRIPWTEEPGGLPSMGSQRVGHDGSNLAPAILVSVKWFLFVVLICISLTVKWFWASFHVLIESSNSYLGIATKILVTVPETSIKSPVNKNPSLVTKHPSELSSQFRAGFSKQPWGSPWTHPCCWTRELTTTRSPQTNRRAMKWYWHLIFMTLK